MTATPGKGKSQYDEVKTPEELESFCGKQGVKVDIEKFFPEYAFTLILVYFAT